MMHRQANFFAAFFPEGTEFGDGPRARSTRSTSRPTRVHPVLVGGTSAAAFRDAPEVWEVMEYFGSADYANARQAAQLDRKGQTAGGHLRLPLGEHERRHGQLTARSSRASSRCWRPPTRPPSTAPTRCPAEVGSGAFWTEGTSFVNGDEDATGGGRRTSRRPGRADRLMHGRSARSAVPVTSRSVTGTVRFVALVSATTRHHWGVGMADRRRRGSRPSRQIEPSAEIVRPLDAVARNRAPGARITSGNVLPAARLRRPRRLPLHYVGPREHRRDDAQGRRRRRPDGGAVGRRQPALRPGLRPLDPVQHHRRRGRSGSSATSSPRANGLLRPLFDKRVHTSARARAARSTINRPDQRLLWGLIGGAALGLVCSCSAPRASSSPGCRSPCRVHRASGSSPPSPSTSRSGPRSTGRKLVGRAPSSASSCSALIRLLAPGGHAGAAVGPHRRRRRLAGRRLGRRRHRRAATSGRRSYATVVPAGRSRRPLRAGHRSPTPPERRRIEQTVPGVDLRAPRRWRSSPSGWSSR